jgi:hypothetical protein
MTPFAVIDLEIESKKHAKEPSHQLEVVAASAGTPWLYSALFQIRRVQAEGRRVAGIGDLRIPDETASLARRFLSLVDVPQLPAPLVSPISGGSLSVTWTLGEKEVKLAFYADGTANYYTIDHDDVVDDGTVNFALARSAVAPLRWLVQAQS